MWEILFRISKRDQFFFYKMTLRQYSDPSWFWAIKRTESVLHIFRCYPYIWWWKFWKIEILPNRCANFLDISNNDVKFSQIYFRISVIWEKGNIRKCTVQNHFELWPRNNWDWRLVTQHIYRKSTDYIQY